MKEENDEEISNNEEFMSISNEELNNTSSNFITETLSLDENILKNNVLNNSEKEENDYQKIDNEFYACYNNTTLDGALKSKEMEEMKYFSYVSTPMVIINQDILSGDIEYTKLEKLANKAYRKAK